MMGEGVLDDTSYYDGSLALGHLRANVQSARSFEFGDLDLTRTLNHEKSANNFGNPTPK